MFSKLKGAEKKKLIDVLTFIVAGTQAAGSALVPLALAKQIVKHEPTFVTIQNETADPAGNVQVFATSLGIAASGVTPAAAVSEATAKTTFAIEQGIAIPEPKQRGGLKGDTYPFALLKVGQSFFLPATEAKPNPAKGLASTVSSANRRYATTYPMTKGKDKQPHPKAGQPTGKDGRTFTVRAVEGGARVWRTA